MARPVRQMPIRDSEYRDRHPLQAAILDELARISTGLDDIEVAVLRIRSRASRIGTLSEYTRTTNGHKAATAPSYPDKAA